MARAAPGEHERLALPAHVLLFLSASATSGKHAVLGDGTVRFATNAYPCVMGDTLLTMSYGHSNTGGATGKPFGMM